MGGIESIRVPRSLALGGRGLKESRYSIRRLAGTKKEKSLLQIISAIQLSSKSMATVFEKLNLKDQQEIVVLNAPASFEPELAKLPVITIHHNLSSVPDIDAVVWFAYPKGTSNKYKCDFNRDTGWNELEALGFETVRAVAIDEDWTGLRFRRSEFVKARK